MKLPCFLITWQSVLFCRDFYISENISKKSYNSSHLKLISINTQIGDKKLPFEQIEDTSYIRKNEDDEIIKIMGDTSDFNKCI